MTALDKAIAELDAKSAEYWENNEKDIARECPAELYEGLILTRRDVASGKLPFISGQEPVQMYHDGYPIEFLMHLTNPLPKM